jgi:hypothetical protein
MASQDELTQLEAERGRLLSMIAYHNGRTPRASRAPGWLVVIVVAIVCGIGVSIIAGVFAGQISAAGLVFLVVSLALLAYISTRRITVFGITFLVADPLTGWPSGRPAGEIEVRQRLADCEARIVKLKEGRP